MTLGNIKWFNAKRELGFITTEDGSELPFELDAISFNEADLVEGLSVEFEVNSMKIKNIRLRGAL